MGVGVIVGVAVGCGVADGKEVPEADGVWVSGGVGRVEVGAGGKDDVGKEGVFAREIISVAATVGTSRSGWKYKLRPIQIPSPRAIPQMIATQTFTVESFFIGFSTGI